MSEYLRHHGTRRTPQSEPIPGTDQVANSAGGYAWEVTPWLALRRFLILGTEGPSYYASERKRTMRMTQALRECIAEDGPKTVNLIVEISASHRAPQNEPALYALAACMSLGDKVTRAWAAENLPNVARIGTHLYHFVAYAETMRGWGRTMRWAVKNWYEQKDTRLDYDAIKYRQRDGWSHRDLLRLAHPHPHDGTATRNATIDWIVHDTHLDAQGDLIRAFDVVQDPKTPISRVCALIREVNLPREALRTDQLNDPRVWLAMLETGMPMTALVRNLATMTRLGVFDTPEYRQLAATQLTDKTRLTEARVHPMALLIALCTYTSGHGLRGNYTWTPKPDLIDALDEGFYLAFDNASASGKRTLLALDVSPSMARGHVAGSMLTPREASVAMALVTLHAEPVCEVMLFTGTPAVSNISKRQRLDDAILSVSNLNWARTDCSLPFRVSKRDGTGPEAFIVYTDNETWSGGIHPSQALRDYREESGIPARSVVCGMVANQFTIADPRDSGMLDVVGFDTATPTIISEFSAGKI